ncbi:hypothetical protein IMSAG250_00236 [Clostridiales bacterium]|nr:hypothetical protein [Eubacterium sp.]GFI71049.1 hypothetical protein IMSAG250_00236 [Clostridiales bacterium]
MAETKIKLSKSAKQKILIAVIILLIVGFVIGECISVLSVNIETQTATATTVYDTIETRAVVIRDEKAVGAISGITIPAVEDGEKVNAGGEIAMSFSSAENAERYSNFRVLEEKHKYYTDLENTSIGNVTDLELLEKNILDDVNSYIRAAGRNDINAADDLALNVNDDLTKRAILVGETVDFSPVISDIEGRISQIDLSSCKPTGYVTADKAGFYSKYTDGCENMIDYSKVKRMSIEDFNACLNNAVSAKGSTSDGGKVINSFIWYFACVVSAEDVAGLRDGYNAQVVVKSTDTELKCTVVKGADVALSADQTLLILSCNEMDKNISSMRLEDIEIRVKSYTGIKVNSSAVHDKDGEKGVYALVSNIAKWRRADVLYTGDGYVILSYDDPDVQNGIKLYDKIIIRGRDVYDGRVFA